MSSARTARLRAGEKYDRLAAEWFQHGRELPRQKAEDVTVATVIAEFWRHAQTYYRKPDGTPSSEATNFRYVLRPLRRLYGKTPAAEFGPKALKVVRDEMIRLGWVRSNVNRQINRLKHVFKWATQEELIPPSVYHGLQTVSGLRAGRSDAPESEPVRPVPEEFVQAVLPHVSSVVAAMIQLQLLVAYSTASLRERLYISADPAAPMAGFIIYTAAGDSEGTLGGLVHLGRPERLGPVIQRALSRASWCSADPVCSEHLGGQGSRLANLAACQSCVLLPETSCETINQGLDRALIVGTPNNRAPGFMAELLEEVYAY